MIKLKAKERGILGKGVKALRNNGLIPAELYGRRIDNIHLSVSTKDFLQAYKEVGEHSVLYIEINGESRPVLIHKVEKNPLNNETLAVDFYEVRMDEKVRAHVPLEFEGESPAAKEKEGILIKNMDEIEVEALPADLPKSIIVNLSELSGLDESIYVRDLPKSSKYKYLVDGETVVVSVTAPKEEVEEIVPEAVLVEGEKETLTESAAEGEGPPAGEDNKKDEG